MAVRAPCMLVYPSVILFLAWEYVEWLRLAESGYPATTPRASLERLRSASLSDFRNLA